MDILDCGSCIWRFVKGKLHPETRQIRLLCESDLLVGLVYVILGILIVDAVTMALNRTKKIQHSHK